MELFFFFPQFLIICDTHTNTYIIIYIVYLLIYHMTYILVELKFHWGIWIADPTFFSFYA